MNIIKTSFFYKAIRYIDKIHEYSFIYKTRKKEKVCKKKKFDSLYLRQSILYKFLSIIGKLFNGLFNYIHKICKSSQIINVIGKMINDIKYNKVMVFNQFMISFIIGYVIANIIFNMFASYKLKYVIAFVGVMLLVNLMVYLADKYKESSLLLKLYNKVIN